GPLWIRRAADSAPQATDAQVATRPAEADAPQPTSRLEPAPSATGEQLSGPIAAPDPLVEPAPLPGDDSWTSLRAEVAACRRCGLCESRRQAVFGTGPQTARWMLIGEAPGAEEDARG